MKAEVFTGILVVVLGALIFLDPKVYGFPVPKELGALFICLGVIYVFYVILFRKKVDQLKKEAKEKNESFVICVRCKSPYYKTAVTGDRCPKCGGKLENIEGFYDRHSDLADE